MGPVSIPFRSLLLKVTFIIVISPAFISGSHFRGGVITWRPASNVPPPAGTFPTVLFNYRVAFRRSFSSGDHACDDSTIANSVMSPGEGFLECDNGCITVLRDDFDYQCTDFSEDADWSTGVGSATFTPAVNMFDAFYEGGNWITLANGGNGPWILRSRVNLAARSDNGLINSSPTTSNMPIIRLQENCPARLVIPVTDPDGDVVRCRYATATDDECGTICGDFNAVLNQTTCTVDWTPTDTGLYGVAIQIEDFIDASSTVALSSVPLQFLFEVFAGNGSCADAPVFDPVVLLDQSCIAVRQGEVFTTRIVAVVSDPSRSITSINTVSPIGLVTTPVQQTPGSSTEYFVDAIFTTTTTMQQQQIFCFVAEDNGGLTSEQRCVILVTATSPPVPLAAAIDGNVITITIDSQITRPDSSRFINIVSASTQQTLYTFDSSSAAEVTFPAGGTTVLIVLPQMLPAGDTYQVNLDRGAVETNDFCGVENEPTSLTLVLPSTGVTPCPSDIVLNVPAGQVTVLATWIAPNPGNGAVLLAGPPEPQGVYAAGTNISILYIHRTPTNTYIKCQFSIVVGPDPNPCPDNIYVSVLRGTGGAIVTWVEPALSALTIFRSHPPGAFFSPGLTCVSYTYLNQLGVNEVCSFEVEVTEVSPCDSDPCTNNGTCLATSVDGFSCICSSCYTGSFCGTPIHACVTNICLNGGECQLLGDSCTISFCECPPCYTGSQCETNLDPCQNNNCQNGGVCTVSPDDCSAYTCECEACFFGAYCEQEISDPCIFNPCMPGLTCTRAENSCSGYTCLPMRTEPESLCFDGVITTQDRCASSPCQNGGTCILTNSPDTGTSGYTCLCPSGFLGRQCGDAIVSFPQLNACTPTSCSVTSICFNSYTSYNDAPSVPEYTCVCIVPIFFGVGCQMASVSDNPCAVNGIGSCQNGGTCQNIFVSPSNDANFMCVCPDGFSGSRCEVLAQNPCDSAPCRNGGSCIRDGERFRCICPSSHTGSACETLLRDPSPPLIFGCPEPIIINSQIPVPVTWTYPLVLDVTNGGRAQLVAANAAPGAIYSPGQLVEVELVYETLSGSRVTCAFWIYINPFTQ